MNQVRLEDNRVTAACLAILTVIAAGVVLKAAQAVVLPLVIAWLLSFILGPAVNVLTRRRVPTALAVTAVLFVLLLVCYLGGMFIFSRFSAFVSEYPTYQVKLTQIIQEASDQWKYSFDPFAGIQWWDQLRRLLVKASGSVISFVSNLVMVIFFLVFLLIGKPYFRFKLNKALNPENADKVHYIVASIASDIGRYLTVQFLISFTTGIFVWLALIVLKVDFPATWGAMAFLLNFIPTVGSIIATLPPVLVALVQYYPALWPGLAVLLSLMTIQMVFGNVISPKVMGDRLNLSPVVVLLSLVFWGWLWGIPGAILSVPIASAIKIVCANIEPLHPISVMMGSGKTYNRQAEPPRTSPAD